MHREAAEHVVEELHEHLEAGCANEADRHAVRPQSVHQRARSDRVLEPPYHLLQRTLRAAENLLLGVPARRAQTQAGAALPRGTLRQRVGRSPNRQPAAGASHAGAHRVQARQNQPPERAPVAGQLRLRESVVTAPQNSALDRLPQLSAAARALQVGAQTHGHRGESRGGGRMRRLGRRSEEELQTEIRHLSQPVVLESRKPNGRLARSASAVCYHQQPTADVERNKRHHQ